MEVAGAQNGGDEEEDADATVEGRAGDHEQDGLAQSAAEGQSKADEVEFANLCSACQLTSIVPDAASHKPLSTEGAVSAHSQQSHAARCRASSGWQSRENIPMSGARSHGRGSASAPSS